MIEKVDPVVYPTSDGKPMGETDVHRKQMIDLILSLERYFRDRDDVYVSGNLLMMYEEGDGNKHRSPDVLVACGVPKGLRDNYKIWEESKAPDLVIEVTSESTRDEDLGPKKSLYARVGVQEYFIFDPLREYLKPQLRGYRLSGGRYVRVVGKHLQSQVLGLELRIVDDALRLYDPRTQSLLMVPEETDRRLAEREAQLAESQSRLDAATRENEMLRKRLHELEGQ